MTDQALSMLLTALDIAAFERLQENGFRPLAQPPRWFGLLSRDGTFPFLGHILEEAQAFWQSGEEGVQGWGPCAELAEDGREFHYLVKALTVQTRAYLVFQLDESAERMRDVLQKVRGEALAPPRTPEPR
jgi:hypothetical protein